MKDTSKTSLRRGHNEGNIRQRTDGRWEVRLSAGIDYKTGKPQAYIHLLQHPARGNRHLAAASPRSPHTGLARSDVGDTGRMV